jgi:hypothetical protein
MKNPGMHAKKSFGFFESFAGQGNNPFMAVRSRQYIDITITNLKKNKLKYIHP